MRQWICAGLAAFIAGQAAAAPDCKLVRIEEWQVRMERNLPIIDGEINGGKVGILVDTGSQKTFITRSAVGRMMLNRTEVAPADPYAGRDRPIEAVRIEQFRIGPAMRRDWDVLVAPDQDFESEVSLILGFDFLSRTDVEFDLPHHAVRLFQSKDCAGSPLAYWTDGRFSEAPLEGSSEVLVTASVNGRPLLAILDSGATFSTLTMVSAARLGINDRSPGVAPAGCSVGIARKAFDYWSAPFESFALGNEVIRAPTLRVADSARDAIVTQLGGRPTNPFAAQPQMILGVDFLRAHRVFIANSQRKVYFTYTGGTVFPKAVDKTCRDLR